MQYKALYRKYRPAAFDDVVGQDPIVKTLQNSIKEEKVSHAYLFSGPRGSGKTSVAKLLANAVNCLNNENGSACGKCEMCLQIESGSISDIVEIDAASNNGVDEIRELRSKVNLLPGMLKYKVYIIDEVHMLSTGAFNALLKTLEEPPSHVIFILATTELHKLPLTIISRCQRFDFRRIGIADVKKKIKEIVNKENIEIDEEAVSLIARIADGGMRDAIGLLDQAALYTTGKITVEEINDIVGIVSKADAIKLIENVLAGDTELFMKHIDLHNANGKDLRKLVEEVMTHIKDFIVSVKAPNYYATTNPLGTDEMSGMSATEIKKASELLLVLNAVVDKMTNSNYPRLLLEVHILNYIGVNAVEPEVKREDVNMVIKEEDREQEELIHIEEPVKLKREINKKKMMVDMTKIPDLIKIRVNNVLADAQKDELINIKKNWLAIREYALDKDLGIVAGLLLDADVKVASKDHLLIAYPYQTVADSVNGLLTETENIISKIIKKKYKVIAISEDVWEKEKGEYVKKTKSGQKYTLIDENVEYLMERLETNANLENNSIVDLLGDIVEVK